ncbi:Maf family protein [Aquabacterium sp.]|uniref:Maf family protein n=1 Tax=Aquabacterium sp. TaxID=1872578 RepID=UPI002B7BB4D1|nr:Maf family protein [Aquabacterium sp.]HSW06377.1 Maf family protein [Aquabacterium sp.]
MSSAEAPVLYLASQSPRRRQLLDQLGVTHALLLPGDDEDAEAIEAERHGELPDAYVQRVTLGKLKAARLRLAQRGLPPAPILASDTTVALGRRILAKPADAAEATRMLTALSGRTHRVLTAVALWTGRRTLAALSISRVHVAAMPAAAIECYVASGEPFGKAGAYAIQSQYSGWISRVEGSYSGIMGLPLYETAQLLRQARIVF